MFPSMFSLTHNHEKKIASISHLLRRDKWGRPTEKSHMTRKVGKALPTLSPYLKELKEILLYNPAEKTVWVEPGVTMDQLLRWCLPRKVMPPVVPEFKQITVGGAINGAALESSSFRYGQFNDPCLAYEVFFPSGETTFASPQENADLFYGISGSYGSLGGVSAVQIPLFPLKDAVTLECYVVATVKEALALFTEMATAEKPPDFLEGMILSPKQIVVMVGRLVSQRHIPLEAETLSFRFPWAKWFCHHVVEKAQKKRKWTFAMQLYDYLFRFDRGAFWMGRFITPKTLGRFLFEYQLRSASLPKNLHAQFARSDLTLTPSLPMRLLTGWKMASATLYRVFHSFPEPSSREIFLVHDFYIPTEKLSSFVEYATNQVGIFPLWLCPIKGAHAEQFLAPHYLNGRSSKAPQPDFINVGIYGVPKSGESIPAHTRLLERQVQSIGGRAMLYSAHEYEEDTFWSIYDKNRYDTLRKKYAMEGYPDLFQKT